MDIYEETGNALSDALNELTCSAEEFIETLQKATALLKPLLRIYDDIKDIVKDILDSVLNQIDSMSRANRHYRIKYRYSYISVITKVPLKRHMPYHRHIYK